MTERDPNLESTTIASGADRPAPTAQVDGSPSGRGGATRWGIALVIVALVVGVAAAGTFLLAGASSPSSVLAYAPADAVTYAELRLDLPGDQRQNLGAFLSHFPGFDDQATLETKLDEALDRIVRGATEGRHDYSTDLKPWFGGQIGFAIGRLPETIDDPDGALEEARALAAVSITDAAAARAWFDEAIRDVPHSTDTRDGVELTIVGEGGHGAMAIVDEVMLLGTVESVAEAIRSGGQGGLATADWFKTAHAALGEGDRVGAVYLHTAGYLEWLETMAANAPDGQDLGSALDPTMLAQVPDWMAGEVRVEGDALAFDAVTPHVEAGPEHENRLSEVAGHVPSTAIAVVEVRDVGAGITDFLDQLRANPEAKEQLEQLDQTIAMLGGWESLVGWIGDASLVVTADGDEVRGGLVVVPTDPEAGARFLTQLRGMVALGGNSLGVSLRDEDHGGTTITYLELGAILGGDVPEVAFAETGEVVVLGIGDGFVESVVDVTDGTSLADSERYRAAIERVGEENLGSYFVDVAALRGLVETFGAAGAATPEEFGKYETDLKPYLEPFDVLVGATTHAGEVDRSTMLVTVK